jgi:hypothetical protein
MRTVELESLDNREFRSLNAPFVPPVYRRSVGRRGIKYGLIAGLIAVVIITP